MTTYHPNTPNFLSSLLSATILIAAGFLNFAHSTTLPRGWVFAWHFAAYLNPFSEDLPREIYGEEIFDLIARRVDDRRTMLH
jgi:hypothetical protein